MNFRIAYLLIIGALTYICMDLIIRGPGQDILALAFCILIALCSWEIMRDLGYVESIGIKQKIRVFYLRCLKFGGSDERERRTK